MSIKAVFFTVVFLLLGALLMYSQWSQLSQMTAQPVRIQLADLQKKYSNGSAYWVILEGGTWDCKSVLQHDAGRASRTKAIYQNGSPVVVYAEFSGLLDCEEISRRVVTGTVDRKDTRWRANAVKENPALAKLPEESVFFGLCTFCDPTNSKIGIIFGAIFVFVGLGTFYFGWKEFQKKRYYWELIRKPRY